jgi:hypothetical protein
MHPNHIHLAFQRVLGRYVVPYLPDKMAGDENPNNVDGFVDENEARAAAGAALPKHASCADASLRSAQLLCEQAYWEFPAYSEIHAVKDVVRVDPAPVWASATQPPPADPLALNYAGSQTYAQFHEANARPLAPYTETFKPKCVPFTRVLAVRTRSPRA